MTTRGKMWQAEVLEVLHRHQTPATAYDVLTVLRETHEKLAPTTIYRALSALTECGRVIRVESLNAFFLRQRGGQYQTSILSICDKCGSVEENASPEVLEQLSSVTSQSGFSPKRHVIEVHGVCESCSADKEQP
ncbi:Fur family transcriptional regulator [Roseibium sp.]|uniref:Fur family transcriptional regulator n=1 Tax=Roseibium sp. TaxID=1936156 RepID=UPI003B5053C2